MAVEVANVTLWLESFVPGLSLSWLGSNLKCGDALIGVADPSVLKRGNSPLLTGEPVEKAMEKAAKLQQQLAENPDRTPEEVKRSEQLSEELREATVGLRTAFDMWAAEPLGLDGGRHALETTAEAIISQDEQRTAIIASQIDEATRLAEQYRFFHWPLEFPNIFHRERPGFDVVVGNPPWNEITVEELAFYALREPGLRGWPNLADRRRRIAELDEENPGWRGELEVQQQQMATLRQFFWQSGEYHTWSEGDTDLYQLFCERYSHLVRQDGHLGVVLPRTAFLAQGAIGFRQWLFTHNSIRRIDLLLNNSGWAFTIHPQYTIALLTGQRSAPDEFSTFSTSGPSANLSEFQKSTNGEGISIRASSLGNVRVLPLLPSQMHADVLAKLRRGIQFDALQNPENQEILRGRAAASHAIPYRELDETQQRALFSHSKGIPVWKGRSFNQYAPHGNKPAGFAVWDDVHSFAQNKRVRSPVFKRMFPTDFLADPDTHPMNHCRIAFRDVTNRTNSRTIIACLIPPRTPLTNSAPYLVFAGWDFLSQAGLLGILNSLPLDWVARRYVETHLNFYVLNMLTVPSPDSTNWQRIGTLAAELSCVDERFKDFAEEAGVEWGPLAEAERSDKRAEIDALVARAYGLTEDELSFIFTDFTENAVTPAYRKLVLEKFKVSEAAKWLGDTGGSAPDMENIPRRRSELA